MRRVLVQRLEGSRFGSCPKTSDYSSCCDEGQFGVKGAAPGNYRTLFCFIVLLLVLDSVNAPISLSPVETFPGAASLTRFCGHARAERNIAGSTGTIQSGSPPGSLSHHMPRSKSRARTTTSTSTILQELAPTANAFPVARVSDPVSRK